MYKKATQIPTRKPTVREDSSKRQKTTIDKKYQTNASEFKSRQQKIVFLIKEYLLQTGYGRSYESLKRQKPVKRTIITNNLISKPNDHSRQIITAFQKGQRQLFFKLTSKIFSRNDEALTIFQCELQVYFYIYMVHPNIKKATSVDKNSMEALKRYLDHKGSELSKNDELLPYFMLPFMPKPQQKLQNQKLAKIFKKQWITKLKQKLSYEVKHINQHSQAPPKTGRKVSQLEQIYNKYVEDQSQNTKQNYNHSEMESKIQQLTLHNKELLSYIQKLQNSFSELGESSKLHIIQSNRKWFNFAKELLLEVKKASKGQKVQSLEKYQGFFGKSLDQLINGADISLFQRASFVGDDRSFLPEANRINQSNLPKKQENFGYQVDMTKIQTLFANADNSQKQIPICLVLKALKKRFTKLNNQYQRRQIIVEYSRHDICGASPQKYYIQKKLLLQGSQRIRQFYLRLAYAITNDIYGIQYLSKSDKLIQNLIGFLKKGQQNLENMNLMFGILQKFSYVKRSCLKLIQLGIIPIILQMFNETMLGVSQLQSFTIQFLTATIMNLSMKKQSKVDFTKHKKQFIQILMSLIQCQNQQIKNYANGSIYLLLNFQEVKQQAIRQNLAQRITQICETYKSQNLQQDNFYNQYNYILERLQKDEQMPEEESDDQEEELIEIDEFQKEYEDQQNWEEEQSNSYIQGQQQYMSGQQYLMKEFMLLGPQAVKEQILNRSVLDETSKKINNMTMSINHSRRMDNIFSQRPGTPTLQPQLDKLLHQDDRKQNKQSKILKKI